MQNYCKRRNLVPRVLSLLSRGLERTLGTRLFALTHVFPRVYLLVVKF